MEVYIGLSVSGTIWGVKLDQESPPRWMSPQRQDTDLVVRANMDAKTSKLVIRG